MDEPIQLSRTFSLSNRLEDQTPAVPAAASGESMELSAFFEVLE